MDEIWSTISFGIGRKNHERVDSEVLDSALEGWTLEATKPLYQKAEAQLGDRRIGQPLRGHLHG